MNLDRKSQRLLLEGVCYTPADVENFCSERLEECAPVHRELFLFLREWFDDAPDIIVHTSGSTGVPKAISVQKECMMQSALLTCSYLGLQAGDTALLCMDLRYIGAMMVVVRALVTGLNLTVQPASGHPLAGVQHSLRFAAMVPLQVYNTLRVPAERTLLEQIEILIIGGGAVDEALVAEVARLSGAVYSTYGMTETLSHIALRRLNGPEASECYYPFPSVALSLAPDDTLIVNAPILCEQSLQTNDIARIYPDGGFVILGRKDNVINSGGIKIHAEVLEQQLRSLLCHPFAITSIPDPRLGQAVVLLTAGDERTEILEKAWERLPNAYCRPRYMMRAEHIPQAGNGKIDRAACRALAERLWQAGKAWENCADRNLKGGSRVVKK